MLKASKWPCCQTCKIKHGRVSHLISGLSKTHPPFISLKQSANSRNYRIVCNLGKQMAERMGFEPMKELLLYTLSKRAPSTTRPPLLFKSFDNSSKTFSIFIVCIDVGERVTSGSISTCFNNFE